jgi:flagellar hook-length control protein FliK
MNIINNTNVAARPDSGSASSGPEASVKSQPGDVPVKSGAGAKGPAQKNFSQTLQAQKQQAIAAGAADPQTAGPGLPVAPAANVAGAAADPHVHPADARSKADPDRNATADPANAIDVGGLLALLPAAVLPGQPAPATAPAHADGVRIGADARAGRAPLATAIAASGGVRPDAVAAGAVQAAAAAPPAATQTLTLAAETRAVAPALSTLAEKIATPVDTPAPAPAAASLVPVNNLLPPLPASAPPAGVHTATLTLAPTQAGWADQVGSQVLLSATAGLQKADLLLHPAELGRVHVQIRIEGGDTGVVFTAEHPAARAALEQSLPQLRDLFSQQGLSLTQTQVFSQTPGDHPGARPQAFRPSPARTGPAPERATVEPVRISRRGLLDDYA